MSVSASRAKASRSVAVKSKLDYPVIDTDLHTIEYTPLLEDYIAKYGGSSLVDDFRFDHAENVVHVRNAPSPGATSSLAIAGHIVETAEDVIRAA